MLVKIKIAAPNPADGYPQKVQEFINMVESAFGANFEIKRTTPDIRVVELTTTSRKLREALVKKIEQRDLKLAYDKIKQDYDNLVAIIDEE